MDKKQVALELGEEMLRLAVKRLLPLIEEYVKQSDNKYDDLYLAVKDLVEKAILDLVDQVDGKVG